MYTCITLNRYSRYSQSILGNVIWIDYLVFSGPYLLLITYSLLLVFVIRIWFYNEWVHLFTGRSDFKWLRYTHSLLSNTNKYFQIFKEIHYFCVLRVNTNEFWAFLIFVTYSLLLVFVIRIRFTTDRYITRRPPYSQSQPLRYRLRWSINNDAIERSN